MITPLEERPNFSESKKLDKAFNKMHQLIGALNQRELPSSISIPINEKIDLINRFNGTEKELTKTTNKTYSSILKLIEKELKIVPKGYYRTLWMSLGMATFGMPLGVAFSVALDNFAFISIGLPIGIAIGLTMGEGMDQKAAKEGRQLNFSAE